MGLLECDDGNTDDGDGCSSTCTLENGYKCTGGTHTTPDTCTQTDFASGTLAQCQTYAAYFSNTCGSTTAAASFAAMTGTSTTCEGNFGGKCIGTTNSDDECTWSRKLCVTCNVDYDTGYTMIRVQTNSYPDHCYYASKYTPAEN